MGFDTYLEIGDQTAVMWRKQSSPLPRMLFRHDQLVVTAASEAGDDEFTYPVEVRFETTAEEALRTLDDSGLGWRASVAAYGETRITAFSGGLVMAREDMKPGASENASSEALRQFEALSPLHDLEALGRVLATQWQDPEAKGVLLFDDITYDAPIEASERSPSVFTGSPLTWRALTRPPQLGRRSRGRCCTATRLSSLGRCCW